VSTDILRLPHLLHGLSKLLEGCNDLP